METIHKDFLVKFAFAHAFTARFEGGLVDHPRDPGCITNYGISFRWLKNQPLAQADIDHDGDIDADDIRALTSVQAEQLFRIHFWDACGLDTFPTELACCLYDCMVNTGLWRAARIAQELCNALYAESRDSAMAAIMPLAVDGALGAKTEKALLFYAVSRGTMALCDALLDARMDFYQYLSNVNPQQYKVFLKGWLRRTNALREYIRHGGT